jgi:hypothetical protein
VRSPKCRIWFAQTSHLRVGISEGCAAICFGISDRRNHGFGCFAGSAIIGAEIKTDLVRFDPGQYQRSAAPRTRRAEVINESKIERVRHVQNSQRL